MRTASAILLLAAVTLATPIQAQTLQDELSSELAVGFDKLINLAETVPADKYDWRPADGVRSFGEAFVHVASAGYFFANMGGVNMPEGLDVQGAEERVTQKDDVVTYLRNAKEHVVSAVSGLSDEDLQRQVEWFDGSERSTRRLMVTLAEHTSEHLGQLIAYSRMNDVTPPWSE